MDPTDARVIVRAVCVRERIELGRVLGRERSAEVIRVRRAVVLELRARGASFRAIGQALKRHATTVCEISVRLATPTGAAAR